MMSVSFDLDSRGLPNGREFRFDGPIRRFAGQRYWMGMVLKITWTDRTSGELRALAGKCRDGAQVRRLTTLAAVLDGCSRSQAAQANGMDRQTLRDWVHRYNDEGVDGLKSRASPGRTPCRGHRRRRDRRSPDLHPAQPV